MIRSNIKLTVLLLAASLLWVSTAAVHQAGYSSSQYRPAAVHRVTPVTGLEGRLSQHIATQYRLSLNMAASVVAAAKKAAHLTGVPVSLVLAVAAVESSFKPHSTSAAGAVGLMQVMPSVHRDVLPVGSELEVDSNVTAGAYILSGYLTKDGDDIVNALQRYNGNRKDSQAHYAHKVLSKMVEFEAAGSGVRSDKAS